MKKKIAMATGLAAAATLAGCAISPEESNGSYEAIGVVVSVDNDHITLGNMRISNAEGNVNTSITSVTAVDSYKDPYCEIQETPAHLENLLASGRLAVNQTVHVDISQTMIKESCGFASTWVRYGSEPLVTAVTPG